MNRILRHCLASLGRALLTAGAAVLATTAQAGQFARLDGGLELYYEESGRGAPIVFIPGWTATTEHFRRQIPHFSRHYRTVVYDPRGQGRSTKTAEGHFYRQHGEDLKALLGALKLRHVVLVGYSWGCHTAYAYFRAHGTDGIRALVCIDSPPKPVVEADDDWGMVKTPADMRYFHDGLLHDRDTLTREFVRSMVTRPLAPEEMQAFIDSFLMTPASIAVQLDYDGTLADYSAEARAIDGRIPVLNILADPGWGPGWTDAGRAWLARNAPHSEVAAFGLHLMQWEFPEKFNATLDAFLAKVR